MTDPLDLPEVPVRLERFGAFVWRDGERRRDREGVAPFTDGELDGRPGGRERWFIEKDKRSPVCGVLGDHGVRFCAIEWHAALYLDARLWVFEDLGEVERGAGGFVTGYDIEAAVFDAAGRRYRMRAVTDWLGEGTVTMVLVEPDGTVWRALAGWGRGAGHEDDLQACEPALNLSAGMPARDDEDEEQDMAMWGETTDGAYVVLDPQGVTIYPADPGGTVATFPADAQARGEDGEKEPEAVWRGDPRAGASTEGHTAARGWRAQKARDLTLAAKGPGTADSC